MTPSSGNGVQEGAFLFVLDPVGIGGAPDAAAFGGLGANTVGHIAEWRQAQGKPLPTHKGRKLYRYFVSQTVLKHSAGSCTVAVSGTLFSRILAAIQRLPAPPAPS